MPMLNVDDEVFESVKARALLWIDASPNDTLRRLLGLSGDPVDQDQTASPTNGDAPPGRAPKADLWSLKRAGILSEGQTLFLHDYTGKKVAGAEAQLIGLNKLQYENRRYSMSNLAGKLLRKAGYSGGSVRGPAHWFTADGRSVLDLWRAHQTSAK